MSDDNNNKHIARIVTSQKSIQRDNHQHSALRYVLEAWEEAVYEGITPDKLAHAALYAALCELVTSHGEDKASNILEDLKKRVSQGEFTIYKTLQ
ncbi:MAG: hypothetical protein AAF228_02440 [Pseudomonadota bacterium]